MICHKFISCLMFILMQISLSAAGSVLWNREVHDGKLFVSVSVPAGMYLYADQTSPELKPPVSPLTKPSAVSLRDSASGEMKQLYQGPAVFSWSYSVSDLTYPLTIRVGWQGCRSGNSGEPAVCMFPEEKILAEILSEKDLNSEKNTVRTKAVSSVIPSVSDGFHNFSVIRSASGYLSPTEFAGFLTGDKKMYTTFSFSGQGFLMMVLLALLGGLALNLTPCVLPLIPVNLAVIGAGRTSKADRGGRMLRGTVYGAGIAVTYGTLGILAVLTGTAFGQIDSSWIFNASAGLIFLVLGLAMFDVIHLDFSGCSSKIRMPSGARLFGVFLLGALSALLAGACVAPVLVAALVQASAMAAEHNYAGLCLPLLVGVGMALPWPLAAAGIALFPKPGAWMIRVKQLLGLLIIGLALYYFWIAGIIFAGQSASDGAVAASKDHINVINTALAESEKTGKPVLLDFRAEWCKACKAMDASTFKDKRIRDMLENDVIFVKLQTEDPAEANTAAVLKRFDIAGLPSYVLIRPEKK